MRLACEAAALNVYGVPRTRLRVFFHYQPQFYRLHAHCAALDAGPACGADRAHLLLSVEDALSRDADHFAKATLVYKLRVGEPIHAALHHDGGGD